MGTRTLPIQLPDDVPSPQFELFQKVRCDGKVGTITGFKYLSPLTALIDDAYYFGWVYCVSFTYGLSVEQAVGLKNRSDDRYEVSEQELIDDNSQPEIACA